MKEIISTNVVWESPDVSNDPSYELHQTFIRDMGTEYRIDSMGAYAVFDKTDDMLYGVINAVEKYGTLISQQKHCPAFQALINGKKTSLPLVQIIASIARGVSPEIFKGKRFRYRDKDHTNLHTDNIWCSGHSLNVFSKYGKKYIIVVCIKDKSKHFAITNFSPQLFDIINSKNWYYDKGAQEITTTNNVKFKHIIWAYYNKSATVENIDMVLESLKIEFNPSNAASVNRDMIVLDHKICGDEKWDNRIENLQAITHTQNGSKNDCTSRIQDDWFYIPTEDGELYGRYEDDKIVYYHRSGVFSDDNLMELRIFCKTGNLPDTSVEITYTDPYAAEIIKNASLQSQLYQQSKIVAARTHNGTYLNCMREMEKSNE